MYYEDRIARGAALLDEKVPGWVERINLATLDTWSLRNCILGQVFGDDAIIRDGISYDPALGFDIRYIGGETHAQLTAEWRDYIQSSRETAAILADTDTVDAIEEAEAE